MPDTENKKGIGKHGIRIPKPNAAASDDALRDESTQYGDEVEAPIRLRKRTDARVPIMRSRQSAPGEEKPAATPELPKVAPKRKKKPRKKRRTYRSLFDMMSATGSDGLFRPIHVFGREIRFWPLIVAAAIAILAVGVMLNNSNLSVTEDTVTVVGLPRDMEGYRIVVLTDRNAKRFGDQQSLLLRTLNGLKYDAIFCLGDMVGRSGDATPFFEFLEGLNHPDRVYFICGDSDPGPFVSKPRNITGTLSEIVLEDWILGAIERGAHYVDAPTEIALKDASMWISPTTMLNLETVSTVETWKDQAAQEEDGVLAGLSSDYNTLPMTDYRYQSMQKLYEAQRAIAAGGIHICLSHERPTNEFIYTSESHDPVNERYLATPELILAGHYCNGVWRIPFVGALYVPDKTMARGGWFPEQALIDGLTSVDDTQIYVTGGLSTNGKVPLMPFRLFNGPEITVVTLTSTLPENMLDAAE